MTLCCSGHRNVLVGLLLLVFSCFALAQGVPVKKTGSDLCHPEHSSYYERIENFQPFLTVRACLQSGGRLPKGLQAANEADPDAGDEYDRSKFGHGWQDFDSDGRDTRAEILIEQSTVPVRFARDNPDRVVHGRWICPYSGQLFTSASDLEADHVYPLNLAWRHGASEWTDEKRERFANDPRNVLIVEASLNSSKQDKSIIEWLPPQEQCGYIARFMRVTRLYDLKPPAHELAQYHALLDQCRR